MHPEILYKSKTLSFAFTTNEESIIHDKIGVINKEQIPEMFQNEAVTTADGFIAPRLVKFGIDVSSVGLNSDLEVADI